MRTSISLGEARLHHGWGGYGRQGLKTFLRFFGGAQFPLMTVAFVQRPGEGEGPSSEFCANNTTQSTLSLASDHPAVHKMLDTT